MVKKVVAKRPYIKMFPKGRKHTTLKPVMKHKSKLHIVRNNFTKDGGVYSWSRFKLSLLAGLVVFLIISLILRQLFVLPIGYELQIGSTNAPVVLGSTYGAPFGGVKIIKSFTTGYNETAYSFDILALIFGYLFIAFLSYIVFTLFSDFNFGSRKATRRSVIAIVLMLMLFMPLVSAAQWNTIAEFTSTGDTIGIRVGTAYVRETFNNNHVFTGQNMKMKGYIGRDTAATVGNVQLSVAYTTGHIGYAYESTLSSESSSMHWDERTYSSFSGAGVGAAEIKWKILSNQPANSYVWIGVKNGNQYADGLCYIYGGSGSETAYSGDMDFGNYWYGTIETIPSVTTSDVTNMGPTTATLNGDLTSRGGVTTEVTVKFEYGTTTSYGSTTPSISMPGTGTFFRAISGLSAGTTYHYRAVAHNIIGYGYGGDRTFTTPTGDIYYNLTMAITGYGATTPFAGRHEYLKNTAVTCTATANLGHHFVNWSGAYSGTTNPCSVVMSADKALTANFAQDTGNSYTLTMAVTPSGGGTTNPSPPSPHSHAAGSSVTCTATAYTGYQFSTWSGAYNGTTNPYSILMDGNKTLTANFVALPSNHAPTIPLTPVGATTGTVDTEYSFVTQSSDADSDQIQYRFDWGDGTLSSWSDLYASNLPATMSHSWSTADTYSITAYAKDEHGTTSSAWSTAATITISDDGGHDDDPQIISFVSDHDTVDSGQEFHLSWEVTGATLISVSAPGVTGYSGSDLIHQITRSITSNTTFTLLASGSGTPATSTLDVYVNGGENQEPTITLSPSKLFVKASETFTITWDSTDATTVTISPIINTNGNVSGTASLSITSTTTFAGLATGPGGTATATCKVEVIGGGGGGGEANVGGIPWWIIVLLIILIFVIFNLVYKQYKGDWPPYKYYGASIVSWIKNSEPPEKPKPKQKKITNNKVHDRDKAYYDYIIQYGNQALNKTKYSRRKRKTIKKKKKHNK